MIKEITCLINKKNQAKFILLEENSSGVCTVINPSGEILNIGVHLFLEEPVFLDEDSEELTEKQLEKYKSYQDKLEELDLRRQREEQLLKEKLKLASSPPKVEGSRRRSSSRSSSISSKTVLKGVVTSWKSGNLTFYKHKIEPLKPEQCFAIYIENVGKFECSKRDFLSNFNEVVISFTYKNEGFYTFNSIPEKAYRFIKNI